MANNGGGSSGNGTLISPRSWVPMGTLITACLVIVGGGWAFIRDSVEQIKTSQTERFASVSTKLDAMQESILNIEKQQYRMEMIARDNWTALLMARWATKLRDLNESSGIIVPDPLELVAPMSQSK